MIKCKLCAKPIESKGTKPRLYCSDACRKAYKRVNGQTDIIETDKVQTDNNPDKYPLTANEKSGKTKQGICHGCGKEVSNICCICLTCVNAGISHKSLGIDINKCD